ncbi:hypothetical protein CWR48_13985 [Oceanobacillus arenosus]|uniref:dUTPase n=1 Tax=Oceanobacillus arenosus TaxID=1229153 RepID=A0A3D8PQQ3_9BACI|nr:dUTP diphosphatase [Oceanobacillus arenosus]RDW17621.1 hypothetical protein CWR48_13985 [Oceanobacillus arenosus]
MSLNKLFETQAGLDNHIVKEKGLEGQDLLPQKILALQVELGECANEWRGFKFWKVNPEPRTKALRFPTMSEEDKEYYNPLLEEYVDCLHFILSIGLDLELEDRHNSLIYEIEEEPENLTLMFAEVMSHTCDLFWSCYHDDDYEAQEYSYKATFSNFLKLGELLGFTEEQIEQAYLDKNKINHERQLNGY